MTYIKPNGEVLKDEMIFVRKTSLITISNKSLHKKPSAVND
jgi:hypothetical protein